MILETFDMDITLTLTDDQAAIVEQSGIDPHAVATQALAQAVEAAGSGDGGAMDRDLA